MFCCSVNVTFIDRDGDRHEIKGKVGDNALYLAHRHDIEMEGDINGVLKHPYICIRVCVHMQYGIRV